MPNFPDLSLKAQLLNSLTQELDAVWERSKNVLQDSKQFRERMDEIVAASTQAEIGLNRAGTENKKDKKPSERQCRSLIVLSGHRCHVLEKAMTDLVETMEWCSATIQLSAFLKAGKIGTADQTELSALSDRPGSISRPSANVAP